MPSIGTASKQNLLVIKNVWFKKNLVGTPEGAPTKSAHGTAHGTTCLDTLIHRHVARRTLLSLGHYGRGRGLRIRVHRGLGLRHSLVLIGTPLRRGHVSSLLGRGLGVRVHRSLRGRIGVEHLTNRLGQLLGTVHRGLRGRLVRGCRLLTIDVRPGHNSQVGFRDGFFQVLGHDVPRVDQLGTLRNGHSRVEELTRGTVPDGALLQGLNPKELGLACRFGFVPLDRQQTFGDLIGNPAGGVVTEREVVDLKAEHLHFDGLARLVKAKGAWLTIVLGRVVDFLHELGQGQVEVECLAGICEPAEHIGQRSPGRDLEVHLLLVEVLVLVVHPDGNHNLLIEELAVHVVRRRVGELSKYARAGDNQFSDKTNVLTHDACPFLPALGHLTSLGIIALFGGPFPPHNSVREPQNPRKSRIPEPPEPTPICQRAPESQNTEIHSSSSAQLA